MTRLVLFVALMSAIVPARFAHAVAADPENGSLDGLGLTHRGMPFLSPPMFAPQVVPSPLLPECLVAPVLPRPRHRS